MRGTLGFLCCLKLILVLLWLSAPPASAAQPPSGTVEFPVWGRTWSGTLGTKQVEVALSRVADRLSGSYCYLPCRAETRSHLVLAGQVQGEGAELTERDSGRGATATGTWHIDSLKGGITGTWTSPDGKRTLALELRETRVRDDLAARFPYEIRLLADALPEEGDVCSSTPFVSAIRLYKDGTMFQTLETESQGTCGIFTPNLVDANFDGWPDLTIAQFLPAGPNMPHQTWLYDVAKGRFVDAPAALQDISSAEFDPVHRLIYAYWRASCCEHGVSTYRWKEGDIEEVETQSSYLLPVLDGTQRRLCYITPSYRDGFIEFGSRVEQTVDGQLKLRQIDPKTCDIDDGAFLERTYIDIWKPDSNGQKPTLVRTEAIAWKPVETTEGQRYCPEVPFFDDGRIRRIMLSENPDLCSEERPQ
jgi:hypothetical protein